MTYPSSKAAFTAYKASSILYTHSFISTSDKPPALITHRPPFNFATHSYIYSYSNYPSIILSYI